MGADRSGSWVQDGRAATPDTFPTIAAASSRVGTENLFARDGRSRGFGHSVHRDRRRMNCAPSHTSANVGDFGKIVESPVESQAPLRFRIEAQCACDQWVKKTRAGDETRTRDINLGKVALYQLSYTRLWREHTMA